MRRLALTFVLPALAVSLSACGAEPDVEPTDEAPAATEPTTDTAAVDETPVETPAPKPGIDPGNLIPAFTAEGTAGETARQVSSQAPGAVTVYVAGSTKCPITNAYSARMNEIEDAYAAKGVQFVWLYPNRTEADDEKAEWHADHDLAGTFVIDRDAKIAKILDIKRTPEIVLTSAEGTITYRGAIDDGKGDPGDAKVAWLANAIDATLAGKPVDVQKTVPAG